MTGARDEHKAPTWSIGQAGEALHVELAADVATAELEKLFDALGTFSHGFSTVEEIVFHLPATPLTGVVRGFLEAHAETVRRGGVAVRFDPEMR